jgi:fructose-1,6-bisphosphatase
MKKCKKCGKEKPTSEFHKDRGTKDGLTPKCKVCNCEQSSMWKSKNKTKIKEYRTNNKEYIKTVKKENQKSIRNKCLEYKGSCCEDCGKEFTYPESKGLYDFHHTNPQTKTESITKLISSKKFGFNRLIEELDKCVLLCKPCHIKRHKDFNNGLRETL